MLRDHVDVLRFSSHSDSLVRKHIWLASSMCFGLGRFLYNDAWDGWRWLFASIIPRASCLSSCALFFIGRKETKEGWQVMIHGVLMCVFR